ncbi:MAG: hypothetical protein ACYTG0_08905 [Planctomycetota bacterium]|jgi:hypothetical protein
MVGTEQAEVIGNRRHDLPRAAAACWAKGILAATVAAATAAAVAGESPSPRPPGENVALGASYALWPRPTYQHCTDPGDATDLTDGRSTSEYFWTQKGTVGWQQVQYATVTIDLGQVQPVGGVSLTTAAGVAGVTWPAAVHVLLSDDGNAYREAGELIALGRKHNGPRPEGYAIRRLVTTELNTRGRYVQFVLIPLPGGPYTFVDEIEVFRGPDDLIDREPAGAVVAASDLYQQGRILRSVKLRFQNDLDSLRRNIQQSQLDDAAARNRFLARLETMSREFRVDAASADASFRAVLPLGVDHARLFQVQAEWWRALGREALSAWVPVVWDPVDVFAALPSASSETIEVHTMRGEYRAAALNLANATDHPMTVRVRFEGLPESPMPGYVMLHQVEWTDTSRGLPVAAALPEAPRGDGAWTVTMLPGLARQVWMTFHVTDVAAGEHAGRIVVESEGEARAVVPVRLCVWPFDFPRQTTLLLGGWSYTDGGSRYGVTKENRRQLIEHLQEHFVNAPWAASGVLMNFELARDDPSRIRLDTESFDRWIGEWPGAKKYMVFLSVAHYSGAIRSSFGGVPIDSPEFADRVGTWITAWVEHLNSKGISPDQLGLLIHDEPHEGADLKPFLAWARAIRAAQPDVLIWEDPTYRNPANAPPELFDACDVLCPNRAMWLSQGPPFAEFYRRQQRKGRTLQFYSCSGPARLLDPYAYYRLQAWHAWQVGATASYFWAFGDNGGSSSWNEYFAKAGPFTPLFLDDRSVTPGKQMEAIRESVEDYEYFVMLEKAVRAAKAAGRSDAAVARAESLLTTAAQKVLSAPGADQLDWHTSKDRTLADEVRVEILEALVSLRGQ